MKPQNSGLGHDNSLQSFFGFEDQSIKQSSNCSINYSIIQSDNQSIIHSVNQLFVQLVACQYHSLKDVEIVADGWPVW